MVGWVERRGGEPRPEKRTMADRTRVGTTAGGGGKKTGVGGPPPPLDEAPKMLINSVSGEVTIRLQLLDCRPRQKIQRFFIFPRRTPWSVSKVSARPAARRSLRTR